MSLIETIRNKPEKTRNMIVAGISGFFVLIILLIGWFVYEAPYKKIPKPNYSVHEDISIFRDMFSRANQEADTFVEPVDEFFTQQNPDLSSEN